jgi:prohibitin 1
MRVTAASLALVLAVSSGCATVGPGHIGVLWRASGGTQSRTYGEGLHYVAVLDELYIYDVRSMSHDEILSVIAINGLTVKLNASLRYHLIPTEVVGLHEDTGPQYYERILEPVLRSEARRVLGQYTPEEIYSTKRDIIEREIRTGVTSKIAGRHIALEAILIRDVELPPTIRQAIDQKLAAEQEVLKMRYVLEVAKANAQQRQIEAQAIADYNKTVAASLSAPILEFERIQQLTRLANSPNAKTVLIGGGDKAQLMLSAPAQASH